MPDTPVTTLSPRQRFKLAFLVRAVEDGLSTPEMLKRAQDCLARLRTPAGQKRADEERSLLGQIVGIPKDLLTHFGPIGLGVLGALPWVGGGVAGYGAAKLSDTGEQDLEEAQIHEKIDELDRLAAKARHTRAMHELRNRRQRWRRPRVLI